MNVLPCPPEYWNVFSKLLDEAFELPPPERERWLETLPGEHQHLKPWLSRVLHADAAVNTGDYLAQPRLPTTPDQDAVFESGQPVGPYRLDTMLGKGGMGEVWRARRIDGALDRTVALKLPRSEFITPGIRQRLQRERDILASLTHPHIAQLYDAGLTPQGQPYLALELIEGQPIDQHCNARRLRVEERVALFTQVLDAVRFAHGRLVVHRDLKPTNILVTSDGQVKLLDFGIAKLLDEHGGGDSTELTRLAGRAMTPEYAAPEQLANEAVSVATDVFSLGIILFELLTGQRPFGRQRTEEAPLASTRVADDHATACVLADPRALRRRLAGDLDAILACCLAHDIEDRYASVEQLADDLARTLAHQPIRARHITRIERIGKFARRHRVPVALGSALALALVIGVVGVVSQARRADAAAAAAQARAQELQRVVDFQAGQLARMDVEQFGTQFLEQMRSRIETSTTDPESRAALLEAFDRIRPLAQPADLARTTLGQYLLEPAKLEIDEKFGAEPRTRALLIGGIARSYSDLGLFENALAEVQRFDEAARSVFGTDAPEIARMRLLQASVLVNVGRARDAIPIARQAADGLARTLGATHLDTLQAQRTLALALTFSEDPASIGEAPALFASIEDGLRAAIGEKDSQYLEARRVHAYALRLLERPQEAATILEAVAAVERQDPQRYRKQLPKVLTNLCEVQSLAGAVDAALAICGEAVERSTQLLGAEHLTTLTAMIFRFRVLEGAGDLIGSFATLQTAYETAQRFAKPEWLNTQFVTLSYAGALIERGRASDAEPILRSFLDQNGQGLHGARASENRTMADTLLARSRAVSGGLAEAIAQLQAVVERGQQDPGSNPFALTYAETILGDLLVEASRTADAKAAYEAALTHAAGVPGQAEELGVSIRSRIAFVEVLAHPDGADLEALRRADRDLQARVGENSLEGLSATLREAVAMLRAGERSQACTTAIAVASRLHVALGEAAPEARRAQRVVLACG